MTTGIKDWSTTAASNNAAPPNGFPEGMAPASLNDSSRQVMAEVRAWYEDPAWIDYGNDPTQTGGTTFTVATDLTARYAAGRRIRMIGTTPFTLYGTIASSSYSAPNTTVTVTMDSGTMDSSLSEIALNVASIGTTGIPILGANNAFTGNNTFAGTSTFSGTVAMTSKAINAAKGADLASASTVNIGAATGNFVDITGTTTITAFDTVQAGTIRVLKFEGILTLTHNGTSLILPTGANITTADGDIATMVSEGSGNWRCIGYQKASGAGLIAGATTFTSTGQTITSAGALTIAHSLGAAPFDYFCELECTTAEYGYSIGDKVKVAETDVVGQSPGYGVSIVPDATNLNVRYGSGTTVFVGIHKTNGTTQGFTNSSWAAIFKAVKF